MFRAKLRKSGNSLIITIPRLEVEALNLKENDIIKVRIIPDEEVKLNGSD